MIAHVVSVLLRGFLVLGVAAFTLDASAQEGASTPGCFCIDYSKGECSCTAEAPCGDCSSCSGGKECACVGDLSKAGGLVQGTVKNRWISRAPAVVYLAALDGKTFPPPKRHLVMDQQNLVFTPHLLPLLAGTTVDFPNNDSVRHNVFSPPSSPQPFNLGTYDVGVTKTVTFDNPGVIPLLCNVHAEMSAYVIVCPTPWYAVTDRQGQFTLHGVPPGKHRLQLWHEKLREVTLDVEVKAGETSEVAFEDLKSK